MTKRDTERSAPTVGATMPADSADTLAAPSPPSASSPSSRQPAPERFVAGAVVGGRYELVGQLGRGAHGAVFRAYDRHADETVALKILVGVRDDYLALLRRELSAARRITHRGVVRMYDLVEVEGGWALSMELIEGASLSDELARGPIPLERVVSLADGIADALAAAHAAEVVHRDLKPDNILVRSDGHAVITDFGISRVSGGIPAPRPSQPSGGNVKLTVDGALLGTPLYMSPEQLSGQTAVGPTADIYAFGLIVFEMLTGKIPHDAESLRDVREKRLHEDAPSIAIERPDAPPELAHAVARCLERDPTLRFADGRALALALHPKTQSIAAPKPAKSHRRAIIAGGAAAVAVGLWAGRRFTHAPPDPDPPILVSASAPAPAAHAPFRPMVLRNEKRVTFGAGCEEYPAFLPDGKKLVFDVTEGIKSHLHELDLESGADKQITTSPMWDYGAAVSPDGKRIAFLRKAGGSPGVFVLDRESGAVRELVAGPVRPTFGEDGHTLWAGDPYRPQLVDVESGKVLREITSPPGHLAFRIQPLPGGSLVGLFHELGEGTKGIIGELPPEGGQWKTAQLGRFSDVLGITPDRKAVYYFPDQSQLGLWQGGAPSTETQTLTFHSKAGLDISRDGRRVAWSTCDGLSNLDAIEDGHLKPVIDAQVDWNNNDAAFLPDGRLALVSDRDGSGNKLWIARADGSQATPTALGNLAVSAVTAQRNVLLLSTEKGLRLVDPSGSGPPTELTSDASDVSASMDHQGDVVFERRGGREGSAIFRVSARGGSPVAVGPTPAGDPSASPTRELIVFVVKSTTSSDVKAIDEHGVRAFGKGFPKGLYEHPTFSADGRELVLIRDTDELVRVDVASERIIETSKVDRGTFYRALFGPKNRLYAVATDWVGDVWVADRE